MRKTFKFFVAGAALLSAANALCAEQASPAAPTTPATPAVTTVPAVTNVPATPAAPVAAGPVYSVLSLIGDQMDVVFHQTETGSNLDPNVHNYLKVNSPTYDNMVARISADAIRHITPAADVKALNTRSQVLFDKQDSLFNVRSDIMSMPDAIKDALKEQGATRMILVGKTRGKPEIPYSSSTYRSAGKLEGIGYFIDKEWGNIYYNEKTKTYENSGQGFIAPYAYVYVTLVDVASGRVLGSKRVQSAYMVGSGVGAKDDPWTALDPVEKFKMLQSLLEKSLTPAVSDLVLAASK